MKRIILLLLFAAFPSLSIGPAAQTQAPEVVRETLKNGLRVVIVPNKLAPVVTTEINYLVGSNEAPAGFPGMAHALEHMMFRGNPSLSAAQLANISAAMGGDFNADTQQTITQYYFTVPSNYLDIALHVESIRMANIFSDQDLWTSDTNEELYTDVWTDIKIQNLWHYTDQGGGGTTAYTNTLTYTATVE